MEASKIKCINAAGFVQEFCVVWEGGSSDWSRKYPNPGSETIDLTKYNIPDGTEVWVKVHAILGKTKEASEHVTFVRNSGNTAVYRVTGATLTFKIIEVKQSFIIEFDDVNFKKYLVEHFDLDGDGEISVDEAEKVEVLNCEYWDPQRGTIKSLKGIEYFKNLRSLNCSNHHISELNLSANTELEDLWCHDNDIKSLDLSNNKKLLALRCWTNLLTTLDVSVCPKLDVLYCNNMPSLTKLYVAKGQKIGGLIKDSQTEIIEKAIPSGKV